MRRGLFVTVLMFGIPSLAVAHVTVRPRGSKAGVEENYTFRVPTERQVATVKVHERYADRTASDWVNPPGRPYPASVRTPLRAITGAGPVGSLRQSGADSEARRIVASFWFSTRNSRVQILDGEARSAYVTCGYSLKATLKEREVDTGGRRPVAVPAPGGRTRRVLEAYAPPCSEAVVSRSIRNFCIR